MDGEKGWNYNYDYIFFGTARSREEGTQQGEAQKGLEEARSLSPFQRPVLALFWGGRESFGAIEW